MNKLLNTRIKTKLIKVLGRLSENQYGKFLDALSRHVANRIDFEDFVAEVETILGSAYTSIFTPKKDRPPLQISNRTVREEVG